VIKISKKDFEKILEFTSSRPQMFMNEDPNSENVRFPKIKFPGDKDDQDSETVWFNYKSGEIFVFVRKGNNKAKWVNILEVLNITTEDQE